MAARTVLHDTQKAAGGKIIDFHGWDMPVQFTSIAAEHQAVRTAAGLFDLGHMGRLRVDGAGSLAFLERRVCRPLADLATGGVRYGLTLAEDGTVEDDVLVSRESADAWHVVVNASNKDKVLTLWRVGMPDGIRLRDISDEQAMVAVQGPAALGHLQALGMEAKDQKYYSFRDVAWRGTTVRLSRTGYTGEDGYECFVSADRVVELWQALAGRGIALCGLGARDTLRLEAGMPLYGNELDRTTTPVEAGLGFAINKQGGFIGDRVVLDQLAHGPEKKLVGLRMLDKRVPRSHYQVLVAGLAVGQVTSGTLSPTLGAAIGMAYVTSAHAEPGTRIQVDLRGTRCDAEIVKLPFYKRAK
ncbi:MAG: glycine cleavage system aminomethyltransferase GcvT [Planctomycetes bacterium]|nr:glycine cleavage system aminomethyltransferase GcvT [Planctomycetota bacterium]